MRPLVALTVAVSLVAALAGCSSSTGDSASGCTPDAVAGDASTTITAAGDFGASDPEASFPTPLLTSTLQVSTISEGDGEVVQPGDYVDFIATQYDSTTGEIAYAAQQARYGASDASDLNEIFECVAVGSRIAAVVPVGDTAGDTDAAVLVIDILDRIPGKAWGRSLLPVSGLPAVVTAPDGTPGITVPDADAPTTLRSAVLKQGDGETVAEGDSVVLQYSEYTWDQPATQVDSSWTATAPSTYTATAWDSSSSTGLWPGTEDAVIGQQTGSQVIVVVPPDDSYSSDETAPDSLGSDVTRIYVIDILAVTSS
ncbi:MAG: hypothetical protein QM635_11050 [Microbacteriaceae bacterium]